MKKHTLKADKRQTTGRKVKSLRQQGIIPATVYGKNVQSESVSVEKEEFDKVYGETGETGLIELTLGTAVKPVLVHSVQRHAVTGSLLHVEFHQVDLKEKVKADIPIVSTGTAQAVEQKKGIFIQVLNDLEVEALPTDLPENIEVDVTGLTEVNDELKVSDLRVPSSVTVLSDADLVVMRISPLAKEEPVEAPPTEGEAGAEATAEGEEEAAVDVAADSEAATDNADTQKAKE